MSRPDYSRPLASFQRNTAEHQLEVLLDSGVYRHLRFSKGGSTPAPRIELTNGQIAQLADFAGTPVAGAPLDEQDMLVIQHAEAGHSGPGLYAHYDELPDEGAIHLDGQLPDSPKGGSDWEASDADIAAWVARNDLGGSFGSKTDARAAFEDARSAEQATSRGAGVTNG